MPMARSRRALTESLEDYLETIYALVRDRKVARVKEIARARGVRMASVSMAMRRLAELGLIKYNQREFIELTKKGERAARRVISRHQLLVRFFREVLHVSETRAEEDACAVEHALSDESVDRMVRFFEFLTRCPEGQTGFIQTFHRCSLVNPEVPPCTQECPLVARGEEEGGERVGAIRRLSDLEPGDSATVLQVEARGAIRQRLIDMGMLPNTRVEVERKAPGGNPIWIRMKGFQLSLRNEEAAGVTVSLA